MTFFEFMFMLMCFLVIPVGLGAYYIGYTTGTEREHDRLCTQFMREKREDRK